MAMTRAAWVLSQNAWDTLLARLGPDEHAAAVEYERLRERLVKYFEWHGSIASEDHADTVLTRIARKVEEGEKILNIRGYALGVARFVLKETAAEHTRTTFDDTIAHPVFVPEPNGNRDRC